MSTSPSTDGAVVRKHVELLWALADTLKARARTAHLSLVGVLPVAPAISCGGDLFALCPACAHFHVHGRDGGPRVSHCVGATRGLSYDVRVVALLHSSHAPRFREIVRRDERDQWRELQRSARRRAA